MSAIPASGLGAQFNRWAAQLPAAISAFAGGALFHYFDLPAPWVSGGMIGAMASRLLFRLPDMPHMMRETVLLMAGITMGSAVTPETVSLMIKMPVSFALLFAYMIVTIYCASAWLTHMHGWRRDDAMLASAPGALTTVMAIAHSRNSDIPGIVVVQTVRLFVLVAVLPGLISALESGHALTPAAQRWLTAPELAVITLASLVLGLILQRIGLAASMMIAGALVSATLHGANIYTGAMPTPIAITGFALVGTMIAGRMHGVTLQSLRRYAVSSLSCLVIALAIACLFAWIASVLVNIRFGAALLAFAPGGLEAMSLLSIALALDPLYVGAHHIARFMSIGVGLPVFMRFALGDPPATATEPVAEDVDAENN